MRNKYPGQCYKCGLTVQAEEGHFERHRGGWRVQHVQCVESDPHLAPLNEDEGAPVQKQNGDETATTYRLIRFDSVSQKGKVWETRVHYGSTLQAPKLSCTCPQGINSSNLCKHKLAMLDSLRSSDWWIMEHWGEELMQRKRKLS